MKAALGCSGVPQSQSTILRAGAIDSTGAGSSLDGSFIFADGSATRTIQFVMSSDFGVVSLSPEVSAVPLPPALPLFASALLALGILGVYARKKQASASDELATG